MRAVSSERTSFIWSHIAPVGSAAAISTPALRVASGLRSSWLASETNRRCSVSEACSRSSMVFMVSARAWISSLVGGTSTRPSSRSALIRATWPRIRSTGRRERPTSSHTATATVRAAAAWLPA